MPSWNEVTTWNNEIYDSASWESVITWNNEVYDSPSWETVITWNNEVFSAAEKGYIWIEYYSGTTNNHLTYISENGVKERVKIDTVTSISDSIDEGYVWLEGGTSLCWTGDEGGSMYKYKSTWTLSNTHSTNEGYLWIEGNYIYITGSNGNIFQMETV